MMELPSIDAFIPYLPVHDLAATRDFYERELGLEVELEEGRDLVLRAAGGHLGFRLSDEPIGNRDDITLTFLAADVEGVYRRLRQHGVEIEQPPARDGHHAAFSFVARDPDGYRLEVRRYESP